MEIYKLAAQERLRFQTNKGTLSTEQLFDLSLTDLDNLAVSLKEEYEKSGKKSFLVAKSAKDKALKLKFDIALDVLTTKVEEAQAQAEASENKAHNQKILGLIAEKNDESLKGKTVKQLEAMLK